MSNSSTFVTFDIETTNLDANYGMVMCAVLKPEGEAPIILRHDEQDGFGDLCFTDTHLVQNLKTLLDQYADESRIIVTWYGGAGRFDGPFIDSRLLLAGELPIRDPLHIDLWAIAKKRFRLNSYRLATVAEFLQVPSAKTAIVPDIWTPAMRGEKNAVDYVVDHCVKDTEVLEDVLQLMKPFIRGIKRGW